MKPRSRTWPLVAVNIGAITLEVCKLVLLWGLLSACGHGGGDCRSTMLRTTGDQTQTTCRRQP